MNNLLSRSSAFLAILALALIPAAAQAPRVAVDVQRIEIRSQAIEAFDPREPAHALWRARIPRRPDPGIRHRDFGGLSGLRVMADGERFLSVTDKGNWLRGRIVYRGKIPIAIADAEMAPILGPDGRPLKSRGWYDAEALAVEDGVAYVGIERVNQVVRFDIGEGRLRARGRPMRCRPA